MKTGKSAPIFENYEVPKDISSYDDAHESSECSGTFKIVYHEHIPYTDSALGPVFLRHSPFVECSECGAAYYAPGFKEWLERRIAAQLILTPGGLSKNQIKFLRQLMDLKQQELAELIGIANRQEVSRMESENDTRTMDLDKQFRLKIHCAEKLGMDPQVIFEMNKQLDSTKIEINEDFLSEVQEA